MYPMRHCACSAPVLTALIVLVTAACSGPPTLPGDAGPDAVPAIGEAELGTGTTDFEPLAANQELVVVAGPQGGHHFIVHARMSRAMLPGDPLRPGLPTNPSTGFRAILEPSGGGPERRLDFDFPPYRLGYEEAGAQWYALPSGRILQIMDDDLPAVYAGRVRIELEVTDSAGTSATDVRRVIAIPEADPGDAGPIDAGPLAADAMP